MILPYRLETLFQCNPISNLLLIIVTSVLSILAYLGDGEWYYPLILEGWSPLGMVGHTFLHAGFFHLFGNMVYLWVFGNAVCANTNNLVFPFLYFAFAILSSIFHNVFDGASAIGASGAINGIVGMATAMYPTNRVSVFWFIIIRSGTFQVPLWVLSAFWLCIDLFGVLTGPGDIAVWAHIGGFVAGLAVGVFLLRIGYVRLTEYDNRSLDQVLFGNS